MTTDAHLLIRYARDRAEDAFAELVQRHVNLVYSAALRQTNGDVHAAQDVTQSVFVELARQAAKLARHPTLAGWLYTTTRHMVLRTVRTEQRRQEREQEASLMQHLNHEPEPEPDWKNVGPVLDEAMHELNPADRLALLLRFFENRDYRTVGQSLGVNENTARMRVDRAMGKLRQLLMKRGISSSATVLAALLAKQATIAAPAGIAATVTAAALSTTTLTTSTLPLLSLMASTKIKAGVAALAVLGVTAPLVYQQGQLRRLQSENQALIAHVNSSQQQPNLTNQNGADADELDRLRKQQGELLRLRSEVGQLRKQVKDHERMTKQNASNRKTTAAKNQEGDLSPEEQDYKVQSIHRMNTSKRWMMGFHLYANANNGQLPATFEDASEYLKKIDPEAAATIPGDQFEIVYNGPLKDLDASRVIVMREKDPKRTPEGLWSRAYGFADGHSEIHTPKDGNFDRFEQQFIPKPPPIEDSPQLK